MFTLSNIKDKKRRGYGLTADPRQNNTLNRKSIGQKEFLIYLCMLVHEHLLRLVRLDRSCF
jgi:hypothetical protein